MSQKKVVLQHCIHRQSVPLIPDQFINSFHPKDPPPAPKREGSGGYSVLMPYPSPGLLIAAGWIGV